jgi:hypothetical protein
VPFRQLDRLPGPRRFQRIRPGQQHSVRPVRQAVELQPRQPDPPGQGHTPLQVPFRVFEPKGPDLGDAQAEQRRRTHVLAELVPPGVGSLGEGEQPLRFLSHDREVEEAAGQEEPQHGEQDLHASAAVGGHRRKAAGCHGQLSSGFLKRSADQVADHPQRGELWAGRDGLAGKPGQELDYDGPRPLR